MAEEMTADAPRQKLAGLQERLSGRGEIVGHKDTMNKKWTIRKKIRVAAASARGRPAPCRATRKQICHDTCPPPPKRLSQAVAGSALLVYMGSNSGGLTQIRGGWLCSDPGLFTWHPPVYSGPRELAYPDGCACGPATPLFPRLGEIAQNQCAQKNLRKIRRFQKGPTFREKISEGALLVKFLSHPTVLVVASLLVAPNLANAELFVRFVESAPKDRFSIENRSDCAIEAQTLVLDLGQSAAGLIFDTEATGAGVEVFQPLDLVAGEEFLAVAPGVADGDNRVELSVASLPVSGEIRFTIDVDDTLAASSLGQIRVAGSEIEGAIIQLGDTAGVFDRSATAKVPVACTVS